jgi:hypothetical protein
MSWREASDRSADMHLLVLLLLLWNEPQFQVT